MITTCKAFMSRVEVHINEVTVLVVGGSDSATGAVEMDQCRLTNTSNSQAFITLLGSAGDFRVTNSIFEDVMIAHTSSSKIPFELAFNTFVTKLPDPGPLINCFFTSPAPVARVENNVILSTTSDVIFGDNCVVNHNVLFPQTATLSGVNTIVDPMLLDPANGDFHLREGSPAIDAAVPSNDLTTDHDFERSPRSEPFEIGAFEFRP